MQISSLFEVGLAMSSEVSLQRLFEVVVDSASRICGSQRCSLMLIDKDGETMRIRAARGIPPEIVAKAEARVGEGISGSVAASGEALFIANIEHDGSFSKDNDDSKYNNASLICVPVLVHDTVVGVLNVNNKQGGVGFTENDLNLLTLLASQAAVAIDNAHRYQDLSEQAVTDGLTGVYIRRYFDETIERAHRTGRATGRGFGLLMIDIDHFKSVNDNYGHQTGDEALRTVAGILKTLVRDEDVLARYGGEEFAIIIARANEKATRRIAERIRSTVESTPVETEAHTLRLPSALAASCSGSTTRRRRPWSKRRTSRSTAPRSPAGTAWCWPATARDPALGLALGRLLGAGARPPRAAAARDSRCPARRPRRSPTGRRICRRAGRGVGEAT